ncbi:unnamed protein product [Brassica rapa]|uniref:Uncharacterized protein n=1 Tax=Brassica campestris TaxID=3711 RepID=A0A3P6D261_BRACM|nr:unnamed protein product [Brassica rapa]VDD20048.1 unnamed protein product [Brassica rapa]
MENSIFIRHCLRSLTSAQVDVNRHGKEAEDSVHTHMPLLVTF